MKTPRAQQDRRISLPIMVLVSLLVGAAALPSTAKADSSDSMGGGGGKNIVQVINQTNYSLRVDGNIQLNRIPGPTVAPVNDATALNVTCTGCQTITVALQINLYGNGVRNFTPENVATAINSACTGCFARADAFQCGIQVPDPAQVPPEVNRFIADMRVALKTIQSDPTTTVDTAQASIQSVVDAYNTLLSQDLGASASCQAKYDIVTL